MEEKTHLRLDEKSASDLKGILLRHIKEAKLELESRPADQDWDESLGFAGHRLYDAPCATPQRRISKRERHSVEVWCLEKALLVKKGWLTLEWGVYHTGTEPFSLPHFPVEFGAIPAIQSDTEVRPNKTAHDHQEKPFHADQHTPVSV